MPDLPLADRVVEVIADLGEAAHPRYRYGSGCVVAGRTVLTAAHVVEGAVGVKVRDPGKIMHEAAFDPGFVGDVDGPRPDLALVEITTPEIDVPAMGLAAVDRDSVSGDPVERCHALGYPAFMEREAPDGGRVRETADAFGHVPVLSGLARGLLSVQVSSAPRPLPLAQTALGESQWSGMSGGPVVAGGLLLGVVTEHAPRAGDSAITATPLTALDAHPAHPGWGPGVANPGAWWARLRGSGTHALRKLPAVRRRAEPVYRATVQDIHQRAGVLVGRQVELAEIASFATGTEGYRWLTGGAWAGKTSLLAEAATALQDECDVVCYFLSRREADADSSRFLDAVVPQLAYLLEEDPPAAELYQFRALWQRATQRADAEDRHLLLAVDGLDEDLRPPGLPSVAALLPALAGAHTHVLVSSRPHPELPLDLPPSHQLAHTQPVPVEPFEGGDELAKLARQEIDDLLRRDHDGLAADVLGLLTAAAGPLAIADLAAMTVVAAKSAALTRRIRNMVTAAAARSLQSAGLAGGDRYQFAHGSLLEEAQSNEDLNDPEFLDRLHQWADSWRAADWPLGVDSEPETPQYLLDIYPSALARNPQRLAALVSDVGWVEAAVQSVGVDRVLADLRRAAAADPASDRVKAMLAIVSGQASYLQPWRPLSQPGYVLRQLCLQASELPWSFLVDEIRTRLRSRPGPGLIPIWATRSDSALIAELGRQDCPVRAVAAVPDGRIISRMDDGRVLVWDPNTPDSGPVVLGCHDPRMRALAVLPDGRVVTGGFDGQVLVWDPHAPGGVPAELGHHDYADSSMVLGVAVLPDGRVVTGGYDGQVLVWDPNAPGGAPAELGRLDTHVLAVAVLPDGWVVTGGDDGRVLKWDANAPGSGPVELGRHSHRVQAVAVLPDGRVVIGGYDGQVLVWNPSAPSSSPTELGNCELHAMGVLPDGRVVTGGLTGGQVLVWDPHAPGSSPAELGRLPGGVVGMAVLPDGRVVTGGADGRVLIWALDATSLAQPIRYQHEVKAAAVLADGRVVTGGADGRVVVWDPHAPGGVPAELGHHDRGVQAVAVLPDGRVVTGGYDGQVLVWDPNAPGGAPAELGRLDTHVLAVAVLPDGWVVTGGDDGRVLKWDANAPGSGPVELGRHSHRVQAVAVLPDGRVVIGGYNGQVLVWDPNAPGGAPAELGRQDTPVWAVAVLPDGRVAACGCGTPLSRQREGWVRVWDLHEPNSGPAKLGGPDLANGLAVLHDGRVAVASGDGVVRVWDLGQAGVEPVQLSCSAAALATAPPGLASPYLVVAHSPTGFSLWSTIR